MSTNSYKRGFISALNGHRYVIGHGTKWTEIPFFMEKKILAASAGDICFAGVESVISDTLLKLNTPWRGHDIQDALYTIWPDRSL